MRTRAGPNVMDGIRAPGAVRQGPTIARQSLGWAPRGVRMSGAGSARRPGAGSKWRNVLKRARAASRVAPRAALANVSLQLTGARSIVVVRAIAIASCQRFPHIQLTARS